MRNLSRRGAGILTLVGSMLSVFGSCVGLYAAGSEAADRSAKADYAMANELYKRGWLDLAGVQYMAFAQTHPSHEFASRSLALAAKTFEKLKQYDKATAAYRFYLEKYATETNRHQVLAKLGDVAWRAKSYRDARMAMEELLRWLKKVPSTAGDKGVEQEKVLAEYRIAWCHKFEGSSEKAIDAFRDFILAHLDSNYELLPMAQVAIGQCYADKGQFDMAVDEFRKTQSEFPKSRYVIDATLGAAEAHLKAGRPRDAMESLAKFDEASKRFEASGAKTDMGSRLQAQFILAEAKQKSGDVTTAAKLYEGIASGRAGTPEGELAKKRLGELYSGSADLASLAPDALLGMANHALSQSKSEEAFRSYSALWQRDSKGVYAAQSLAGMGRSKALEESWFDAASYFLALQDLFPKYEEMEDILFTAGVCLYKVKATDSLIRTLDSFISQFPASGKIDEGVFLLAESLFQSKEYQKAAEKYDELAKKGGKQAERCQFRLAGCLLATGDKEKAKEAFKEFLTKNPSSELALQAEYKMVDCDYDLGRFEQAANGYFSLIERFPDGPLTSSGCYLACLSCFKSGNMSLFQNAWSRYDKLIQDGKGDPVTTPKELNQLGHAVYEAKKEDEAARIWGRLALAYPEHALSANTLFWIGERLSRLGDLETSLTAYRRCAELDANAPIGRRAQYGMAEALRKTGKRAEASDIYKGLSQGQDSMRLLGALGLGKCMMEAGDFSSSLEPLAQAARESQQTKDPELASLGAEAWALMGESYFRLGQFDKAKENLEMVSILPSFKKYPETLRKGLFMLGETYEKTGSPQQAYDTYSRVAKEFASSDEGIRSARKVDQLKGSVSPK